MPDKIISDIYFGMFPIPTCMSRRFSVLCSLKRGSVYRVSTAVYTKEYSTISMKGCPLLAKAHLQFYN